MARFAVLIEDNYQIVEAWYPYLRLREDGGETVFVGSGRSKTYTSKEGYPANEERSIDSVNVDDFDGVVIPGGYAADMMRRKPRMAQFVREMYDARKLVAAICHAGWMLASAGILKGKRATGFPSIKDDMVNAGAMYVDEEVVVDGNLVTSRRPTDLPAFCREILRVVNEESLTSPRSGGAYARSASTATGRAR
jgi:protease I